jgi:formate dehydrogenase maturation protein FdhE
VATAETTYFKCACGREWHNAWRFKCDCGSEKFETITLTQEVTQYERDLVAADKCPRCKGPLDTGWECNDCDYDARPIAMADTKSDQS